MSTAQTVGRVAPARGAAPRRPGARAIAGEQLAVATGQLAAGVGNLVFSLLLARLLAPSAFADMAAFLALYLVVHVPASSLSAGSALTPSMADHGRRRMLLAGGAVGVAIAAGAVPLASLLHLPMAMLMVLAAAAPTAGLLALDRGRLYGLGRKKRAVASLLAEPVVRLSAGVVAAALIGPIGGAAAVVAAGWAALLVARLPGTREVPADAPRAAAEVAAPRGSTATVLAFLGLAIAQNQDILLAKGLLPAGDAAQFAVLSTIGGVAAFATTTIPLMLLPRARESSSGALPAALGVAFAFGAAGVAFVAIGSTQLVTAVFGDRYGDVAPLAAPYVGAMALLGIARVFVADACARGRARAVVVAIGAAVAVQAALIVTVGHDPRGVAMGTLVGMVLLTVGTGATALLRAPTRHRPAAPSADGRDGRDGRDEREPVTREKRDLRYPLAVAGITIAGLVLRLLATRGIWLDEATSAWQAQMPFGKMLTTLRDTDVHPPLHDSVLWVFVHLFGSSELALRAPSLIAGTLLIPTLYAAGRDIYDRRAGLAAALFAAVAPFAVWYSQEARMYAFFMLFAAVALWMQVRAVRHGRKRDWVFYTLASAALIWNQYFAALFVGVQQLGFLAYVWQRRRQDRPLKPLLIGWGLSLVGMAILLAPLASFALHQFHVNESAGKGFEQVPSQAGSDAGQEAGPSIYGAITNFVWAMWGYHSNSTMTSISALWPFAMLLTLLMMGRGRSTTTKVVVACALAPAVALFVLGQIKPFVFEVRYFIATVPVLILLLGRIVTSWGRTRMAIVVAVTVATMLFALGSADQQLNGTNPRVYDFKGAFDEIEAKKQPGDVVLYAPQYLNHVVDYYGHDLDARPLGKQLPGRDKARRIWIVGSFLDKPQYASQTGAALGSLKHQRRLIDQFHKPQIRVWEFR